MKPLDKMWDLMYRIYIGFKKILMESYRYEFQRNC